MTATVGAIATGCVVTTDPLDDDGGNIDGYFTINYTLDGGCPAGATTIWVVLDGVAQESYDCTGGGVIDTDFYLLGSYSVALDVTDASGTLYAASDIVDVSLNGDATPVSFNFPTNDGYFGLDWDLFDSIGALTCEDVGAATVELSAIDLFDNSEYVVPFNCGDYTGVSDLLPVSDFNNVVFLLDGSDGVMGQTNEFNESILYGNELVELGLFQFEF